MNADRDEHQALIEHLAATSERAHEYHRTRTADHLDQATIAEIMMLIAQLDARPEGFESAATSHLAEVSALATLAPLFAKLVTRCEEDGDLLGALAASFVGLRLR